MTDLSPLRMCRFRARRRTFPERAAECGKEMLMAKTGKLTPRSRYCAMHNDYDTNGNGRCLRYATAHPQMRDRMLPCLFLKQPSLAATLKETV